MDILQFWIPQKNQSYKIMFICLIEIECFIRMMKETRDTMLENVEEGHETQIC